MVFRQQWRNLCDIWFTWSQRSGMGNLSFSLGYLWDRLPNPSQQAVTIGQFEGAESERRTQTIQWREQRGGRGVPAGNMTIPGPRRSSAQLMPRHPFHYRCSPAWLTDRTSEGQAPASCKHNAVILFSSLSGAKFNKKKLNEELILTSQCASKSRVAGKGFIN